MQPLDGLKPVKMQRGFFKNFLEGVFQMYDQDRFVTIEWISNHSIYGWRFTWGNEHMTYALCSKKEAIREFRRDFGLVGKHLDIAEI